MMIMEPLRCWIQEQIGDQEGQGLVEYALIIALIAILLIATLTGMKDAIVHVFTKISSTLKP